MHYLRPEQQSAVDEGKYKHIVDMTSIAYNAIQLKRTKAESDMKR